MNIVRDFVGGMLSVLKATGAPLLYRYPYRNSAEGLRADWLHIGKDIQSIVGHLEAERRDGRTGK